MREVAPRHWWALNVGGYDVGVPTRGRNYTTLSLPSGVSLGSPLLETSGVPANSATEGEPDHRPVDPIAQTGTYLITASDV